MEFNIEFSEKKPNNEKQLIHLKNYLEKARINELDEIKISRSEAKTGEMGAGILQGITGLITGGSGPLTKLAEALVKYVEILRSEVKLKSSSGEELVINAKLNKKSINELVDKFFKETKRHNSSEFEIKKKNKKQKKEDKKLKGNENKETKKIEEGEKKKVIELENKKK